MYDELATDGNKARLTFKHLGGGMVFRNDGPGKSFQIAGGDRKFVPAQAEIDGDAVIVWSDAVPKPAAVRCAWADDPVCTLYNKDGLPASPFRTDDWPVKTSGKR